MSYEEEVTPMVLLSHHEYVKLKKHSDLYLSKSKEAAKCCDCKKSATIGKIASATSTGDVLEEEEEDLKSKEGHGEGPVSLNSFDSVPPQPLPIQYTQPNNEYQAIELNSAISLVPKLRKDRAKESVVFQN